MHRGWWVSDLRVHLRGLHAVGSGDVVGWQIGDPEAAEYAIHVQGEEEVRAEQRSVH